MGRKKHIPEPEHTIVDPVEKLWEARGRYHRNNIKESKAAQLLQQSIGVRSAVDHNSPAPPPAAVMDDLGIRCATYSSRAARNPNALATSVQVDGLIKQAAVVYTIQESPGYIPPNSNNNMSGTTSRISSTTGRMQDRIIAVPNAPVSPASKGNIADSISRVHMRGVGAGELIMGVDPSTGIPISPSRASSLPAGSRRASNSDWFDDRGSTKGYGKRYASNNLSSSSDNPLNDNTPVDPVNTYPKGWGIHGVNAESAANKKSSRVFGVTGVAPGHSADDRLGPWEKRHVQPTKVPQETVADAFASTGNPALAGRALSDVASRHTISRPDGASTVYSSGRRGSVSGSPRATGVYAHSSSSSSDNPLANPEIIPNQRAARTALFGNRASDNSYPNNNSSANSVYGSNRSHHYQTNLKGEGASLGLRPDQNTGNTQVGKVRRDQESVASIFNN